MSEVVLMSSGNFDGWTCEHAEVFDAEVGTMAICDECCEAEDKGADVFCEFALDECPECGAYLEDWTTCLNHGVVWELSRDESGVTRYTQLLEGERGTRENWLCEHVCFLTLGYPARRLDRARPRSWLRMMDACGSKAVDGKCRTADAIAAKQTPFGNCPDCGRALATWNQCPDHGLLETPPEWMPRPSLQEVA